MTIKECYEIIGNYEEVTGRLGNDARILKYLTKFCSDTTYDDLCAALDECDYSRAFVCVHNLKGLYLNLSMTHVGRSSSALCEVLRKGAPTEDISELVAQVKEDHKKTVETIEQLLSA